MSSISVSKEDIQDFNHNSAYNSGIKECLKIIHAHSQDEIISGFNNIFMLDDDVILTGIQRDTLVEKITELLK